MTNAKRFFGISFWLTLTLLFFLASAVKARAEVISSDANLGDFTLTFNVTLGLNPKEWPFGISLRQSSTGSVLLYCYTSSIGCLESLNGINIKYTSIGNFNPVLTAGTLAAFKVVCSGSTVTIYKDNMVQPVAIVGGIVRTKGTLSLVQNTNLTFTNINLTGKTDVSAPEPTSVNIIKNGGFEKCTDTVDGLPDYWGCPHWGMMDPYWVVNFEDWHHNFGVDKTTSFEGKGSMRINNPFDKPGNSALLLWSCILQATPNKEYTLSAYLKGEPAGMKVNFAGKEIFLAKDWQRYSTAFITKGESLYQDMINIYPLIKGTFWVDAVQLEKGSVATPYVKSLEDDQLLNYSVTSETPPPPATADTPDTALEFKTQYDLYTKETDLVLEARSNLTSAALKNAKCVFEIKDAQGNVSSRREIKELNPKMEVVLPLSGLADGKYRLTGQLMDENGKIIAQSESPFSKLPPKPYEVKVDKLCRMVTVDGKPYIPFGLAWEGDLTYGIMEHLVQNGFTFVASFAGREQLKSVLDNAAKAGLKVKVGANGRDNGLKGTVEQLKEHPALLAWDIFDEVFTVPWGKENYQTVVDTCQAIQEVDPYHPVYLNENEWGINYLKSKALPFPGAIVSIDAYPYPPLGNINLITNYCITMEEMGRKKGKPSWIYPFGGGYAFQASREFTAPEQEFYTYTALINGVTGFMYFASHPRSTANWNEIKKLNQEIKQLTPVIASREEFPAVKCSSPSVQVLVKSLNHKLYLITVNSSKEPVTGRFNIPGLKKKRGGVQVLFEKRRLNYTGEFLEDTFAGYQRHVYEIGM